MPATQTPLNFIERRLLKLLAEVYDSQTVAHGGFKAMADAEAIWEANHLPLHPILPHAIDRLLDIVLHPKATVGTDDRVRFLVKPLTTDCPVEQMPGEFGYLDAKLLAYQGIRFISAIAEVHPHAFTEDHVHRMLDVAVAAENNVLCSYGERNIYEALAHVARTDATLFSRDDVRQITENQDTGFVDIVGPQHRFPYKAIYTALGMSRKPSFVQHLPLDPKQPPSRDSITAIALSHARLTR